MSISDNPEEPEQPNGSFNNLGGYSTSGSVNIGSYTSGFIGYPNYSTYPCSRCGAIVTSNSTHNCVVSNVYTYPYTYWYGYPCDHCWCVDSERAHAEEHARCCKCNTVMAKRFLDLPSKSKRKKKAEE